MNPTLKGLDQWPNIAQSNIEAHAPESAELVSGFFEAIKPPLLKKEGEEAFREFWERQKELHKGRSLPTCGSVAKWLFISGYDEGRCR